MNTIDAVRTLRQNGVELHLDAEAGRLKYRITPGTDTERVKSILREYLPEIVHDFTERAAIMECGAHLPRRIAQRSAALEVGIRRRSETANPDRPSWAYDPDLDSNDTLSTSLPPNNPANVPKSGRDAPGAAGGNAERATP